MNQFVGFCILLAGLFGIATMLLWRLPWPKREPWRTFLEGLIVVADLAIVLWLNRYFSRHSYELITTTLACSHFSFVCFWCVVSRGPSLLRLVLFLIVVAAMFALFSIPSEYFVHNDAFERDWLAIQALSQRFIITCVATWMAGIFCRLRGWRLESPQDLPIEKATDLVRAAQTVPLLIGLGLAVPCVLTVHGFVSNTWTNVFDRDFSILALGCFYGLLMLAVLAVTACRFKRQWISGGIASVLLVWMLYKLGDARYDSLDAFRRGSRQMLVASWSQYTDWLVLGTLWWWLIWKHLQGVGFSIRNSDESILTRPKLKHVMISMVFMAVLFTSVKSRYFDRYEDLIRQQVQYSEPKTGPIETITISSFVSERVTGNLGKLKKLRRLGFYQSTIDEDLMQKITRLKNLEALAFVECELPPTGLKGIETLEELTHVEFVERGMPTNLAESYRLLSQLEKLEYLALSDFSQALALPNVEHLDLSQCLRLDPKRLLKIDLKNVRTIDFPRFPQEVAFDGVPSAELFPRLTGLKVKLPTLTPTDVAKIKAFTALERLEIVGCKGGLERTAELEIEHLSMRECELTDESLDAFLKLDKLKSFELDAATPKTFVQRNIEELVLLAKRFKAVTIELRGTEEKSTPGIGMGFLGAGPGESRVPFQPEPNPRYSMLQYGFGFEYDSFSFRPNTRSALSNVTIEFDQALDLLTMAPFELHNVRVMKGDRLMTTTTAVLFGQSLNWLEIKADELALVLKTDIETLGLVDPQVSLDDYSKIRSSKLQMVSLTWNKVPQDWEQILEQLLNSSFQIAVGMPDGPEYEDRQITLAKRANGRLQFHPVLNAQFAQ